MKMLMKTEWKIKMQIKIKIKTKNTNQNVNDDRKTHIQMQIEIKVAEPPRIPYLIDRTKCRTSRHVWLSSSACDLCCAYQLICIMTIRTYTTGARAEMTRQLGSCTVKKSCKCKLVGKRNSGHRHWTKARRASISGTNGSI